MGVLKWIGSSIAAIFVLSVIVGIGLVILSAGAVIAAFFWLVLGIGFLAFLIKEAMEGDKTKPTGSRDLS